MSYKDLSKFEKLAEIQELNFSHCERHSAAIYLRALWLNDIKVLEDYERFGHTARHILMNKRAYDRQLLFGFTEYGIDEHGWIIRPDFMEYEKVEFALPKNKYGNSITIGRGLNHKWTSAVSCSNSTGGHGSGLSIWGDVFNTRDDAITDAIQYIILWHEKQNKDIAHKIIKMASEYLESIKPIFKPQPLQLQLL